MSPKGQNTAPNSLYTAILALAFCAVVATAAFVAIRCFSQYDTIFSIP